MEGERLREVMRGFPQGVVVVTAQPEMRSADDPQHAEPRGITVSSFLSVSLSPSLILISIVRSTQAHAAIERAGGFAVSFLAEDQRALSDHFARGGLSSREQFQDLDLADTSARHPVLASALAYLDCRVVDTLPQADHSLFIGAVQSGAVLRPEARPLIFYSRGYWSVGDRVHERP
jgi:flavin reductase (DIM6/NTAB) family NADH-FMN oxidoreductase RutF